MVPQVLLEVSLDRKPTIGEFLDKARSLRLPRSCHRVPTKCPRANTHVPTGRMGRQGDRVCLLGD